MRHASTPMFALVALLTGCASERLVWQETFDVPGAPDPTSWTFEEGFVRNREMQWYQPQNATVRDGVLVIEGRRESRPNPWHKTNGAGDWRTARKTIEYTSACLHSTRAWLYGRVQVRARLQAEEGLWPAIWFLGANHAQEGWPACGEVDLLEYYDESILANLCWSAAAPEAPHAQRWNTRKTPIAAFIAKSPTWRTDWHVWEMVWTPDRIDLLIDGETINSQRLDEVSNPDGSNPFRKPMFLLLNLAMGSTGGSLAKTDLPGRFEVDWVRVWQREP